MPTPAEELAARLTRMDALVKKLEQACSENDEQREACARLFDEIQAARDALRPLRP